MKKLASLLIFTLMVSCQGNSQKTVKSTSKETPETASYAVAKTDAQWRAELTDMEYYILRKAGTENPGTSEWLKNKKKGTYVCAGCGHPLFESEDKFDSGTGWPSFDRAIKGNVAYSGDYKIG